MGNEERLPPLEVRIRELCPNAKPGEFVEKSPRDTLERAYNCVAWAMGFDDRWWQPAALDLGYYWPDQAADSTRLAVYLHAFRQLGFTECEDESLEDGFERIVVFADDNGEFTHVARQLADGRWTSKLGGWEDIDHDLRALEGGKYGRIACFMRRPRSG